MNIFEPKVLAKQISEILTNQILEGTLKGNQKLVEANLQNIFKTSKSPIREALIDLEKKGLVIIKPRRGAYVKEVTLKDIEEVFPVRGILEGLAAREAYKRINENGVLKMESIFKSMEKAIKNNDIKRYRYYHYNFHQIFIDASENNLLIGFLKRVREHILWYRFSYKYFQEDFDATLKIHKKILSVFKTKSSTEEEVESLVRSHIKDGYFKFLEYLKNQKDANKEN